MRYNNTERLGVIESSKIITKEIKWIFREQPIVDVGLDAIIEEVINEDPTGRFIAAQIKTGIGNFHISNKSLTYYVSNIHYNYWLNLVLPVILIAYLPESNDLYWQIISDDTLRKTKKKWKIEIPRNKILGSAAKTQLTEILNSKFRQVVKHVPFQGDPFIVDIYSIIENIDCIKDATRSTIKLTEIMTEMSDSAKNFTNKIYSFINQGFLEFDVPVVASINKFAHELRIFAKRIENEIEIFSELFGIGIAAYIQVSTIYFSLTNDETTLKETKEGFKNIINSINEAQSAIKVMQDTINKLPKKYPKLKVARNELVGAIELVLEEYSVAKDFLFY
jgi:hypothetical protein